jgi:serine/threonine protein kinase
MDATNHADREKELFEQALDLPSATERTAFLKNACGQDAELLARLEALLRAHETAEGFLPDHPAGQILAIPLSEKGGDRIGRYKLLEKIGEGGMGVVYMAEQEEPVRRRVALKIIKLGMDTRSVVARFEAERQALALMDHPNIAKVLDAGATETGRPFFVMELVQGVPITEFCETNQMSFEQRVKLFIPVCQAIQSAHQKGIVHRDLKPTNVLVTLNAGMPHPMVIDFGVAKATNQKLTEKTLFTNFATMIGTPAYMSPEQAEMSRLDVDTRSDIYSLGVLLYELLTGTTPFPEQRLHSAGYHEMQRIIIDEEPERPSTRLRRKLAATPANASDEWQFKIQNSKISGDLDWIVMKCLEKDRARRYETANGLAMDLQRHLNNEPVVARPPSKLYEFQKTVRRHKVGFAATAAILLVLLAGVLASTRQAARATNARREQSRLRVAAEQARANEAKQKAAAQQELYDSLLGQARATRLARQLGYRDRVFDLLERASVLDVPQKNLADLRNEAVACLGDFVGLTPVTFTNFSTNIESACLAPSGRLAAFGLGDSTIHLLKMPSGKEVAHFACAATDEVFQVVCFNSAGDQLFAESWKDVQHKAQYLKFLSRHQLYSWACHADGQWQETGNRSLPGASDLLNGGTNMFATVFETGPFNAADPGSRYALKFRLYDASTDAFVAGHDVTITMPAGFDWQNVETSDGQLLVVETSDHLGNLGLPAVLTLYDWNTGRRINELHLPAIGAVNLSPDGKYLSWLSFDAGGGAIYTIPALDRIGQFMEYFQDAPAAVFSRSLAALPIAQQNRIRLWNLATRENVAVLDEPEPSVPVAFSDDGNC